MCARVRFCIRGLDDREVSIDCKYEEVEDYVVIVGEKKPVC
jgi:hypothetical protein